MFTNMQSLQIQSRTEYESFLENLALTYVSGLYGPRPLGPYGPGSFIIWRNFLRQICSRSIYLKCILLQEHVYVCYILLEQYAFQIWSWSIFNLKYSPRLLMVQDHMSLDHKSRPKSQKKSSKTLVWEMTMTSIDSLRYVDLFWLSTMRQPLPFQIKKQYLQIYNIANTVFSLWILGQLSPKFKGCIYKHTV